MKFFSTNDRTHLASFEEACMRGLAPNRGLYMPLDIPRLSSDFIEDLRQLSFVEIAAEVGYTFLSDEMSRRDFEKICDKAFDFPAPVVPINDRISILELFHGPSLAFKDFGARFMAQTMSYFNRNSDDKLIILVATSGDTGGAVAAGFLHTPGIDVVILYPNGRVSELQELQLTTLGRNIHTLRIDGSFDDCQDLVKTAFSDLQLNENIRLSSANSINIARLLPQSFYYFESFKQLKVSGREIVYAVPSGNFGNLTAGLFAKEMGLPIQKFIAATNVNDIVPKYLVDGNYAPKASVATISNAMDVGNPSNFLRMQMLYPDLQIMQANIMGEGLSDHETQLCMQQCFNEYGYILDPHTAIGFHHAERLTLSNQHTVVLSTAHPAKFLTTVERTLNTKVDIPERLSSLQQRQKHFTSLTPAYNELKNYLLDSF